VGVVVYVGVAVDVKGIAVDVNVTVGISVDVENVGMMVTPGEMISTYGTHKF